MKHAFTFPGQGSQKVGMLAELGNHYPIVKQTFEEASNQLNYDLWKLAQQGPEEELTQTEKTQPVLLASSVSIWRVWKQQGGIQPVQLAGHSFGEYSALVCAGALSFPEAVLLAEARGQFMQRAIPVGQGAMAAILGLSAQQVTAICEQVAEGDCVSPANFNAPEQIVIAGHQLAVERALAEAKQLGAKRTVLLAVSVPAHCQLMQPAALHMADRLIETSFTPPQIPVIHNVDVASHFSPPAIRQALVEQLTHPVRWTETIQYMAAQGITCFIEAGPGKILAGLNKRISPQTKTLPVFDLATLDNALRHVAESAELTPCDC